VLIILFFVAYALSPEADNTQVSIYSDRLLSVGGNRTDSSLEWRLWENYYAMQSIRENLWMGISPSNSYRPPFEIEVRYNSFPLTWYVHNAYLWVAVMMGLFGLIPFLWLSFLFIFRTFRRWSEIKDPQYTGIYLGFGAAYLGMMISNLVAPNFIQSWALTIYPAAMAINEVIYRLSKAEESQGG
jgi:O-antigen ligase